MKIYRLLIIIFLILLSMHVFGDTKIVDGEMSFEFTIKSGNQELLDDFFEYENNSNSQRVVERGSNYIVVRTTAKLDELRTDVPFPVDSRYTDQGLEEYLDYSTSRKGIEITRGNGQIVKREFVEKTPMTNTEIARLRSTAESVTSGAATQHEAVEAVMRYIRENVSYTLRSSSNPVDVLRTGKAYCEGYANVAALLLRVVGIPTKVVDSYIPPGHMWGYGQEGSGAYHAHVEVFYDDAGWVSYDPQATVHFVDPFHIVNYPREKVVLQQGEEQDKRNILDILPLPSDTNNFFQRDTTSSRASAVFAGMIYRSDGSVVRDSFRNDEWMYLRREDGTASGIRILSNGQFAVTAEEEQVLFYRDGRGGWYEQKIDVEGTRRVFQEIRLDRRENLIRLDTGGAAQVFSWQKNSDNDWMIEKVATNPDGMVSLLSDSARVVLSTANSPIAGKYVVDAEELEAGRTYQLTQLPRYLDPNTPYVSITPPTESSGEASRDEYSLKFLELSSGRSYEGPNISSEATVAPVPDADFSTVVLQRKGAITITSLPELTDGKISPVAIEGATARFEIQAGRSNYPVHVTLKRGRRFASLVNARTDDSGRLILYFPTALLNDDSKEFVLLHGSPLGSRRVSLEEAQQRTIQLE
ncbi:MAG: transglutaminase-like domain-containing protein [Spirochaetia bacterium]